MGKCAPSAAEVGSFLSCRARKNNNHTSTCAIVLSMPYMPSLRLSFPGGVFNDYRLNQDQVEFRTNAGAWRTLDADDIQLHYLLRTEVAKWLVKETVNAQRTGT